MTQTDEERERTQNEIHMVYIKEELVKLNKKFDCMPTKTWVTLEATRVASSVDRKWLIGLFSASVAAVASSITVWLKVNGWL